MAKPNRRPDHQGDHRVVYERNRKRILASQSVCGICGQPVDKSIKDPRDPMAPTIDHIIPISRGGHPSDISNLQLAHRWCNRQKADKLDSEERRKKTKTAADTVSNRVLPLSIDWKNYAG
jgi:5-methylcytosine-specific restriction endonuclease McrA